MRGFPGILLAMLGFILAISYLLFIPKINDFSLIFIGYTLAFSLYVVMMQQKLTLKQGIILGIALRVIAVFSFPALSDDIYRFIWDGILTTEGYSVFSFIPSEYPGKLSSFQQYLLEQMNSPDYYSVYPSVLQSIFAVTSFLVPDNIIFQSIILKCFVLAAELGTAFFTVKILDHLKKDRKIFLWYFLNPLVIVELMGNLHMESLMICGFAVFLYYFFFGALSPKKYVIAGLALSLSVGSKLMTILAAPFLWKRIKNKRKLIFFSGLVFFLIALFLPMLLSSLRNFGSGLDLYFQKFEFNASIYYLARELGYLLKGYNLIYTIGPVLGFTAALFILYSVWKEKNRDLVSLCNNMVHVLTVYYLLSTTVHPWYITVIVFLSIFSEMRYPIFWSFVVIFSYSKYYLDGQYYYYMVFVEYLVLFFSLFLYLKQMKKH